jgi:hypothetical protein
LLHSVDIFQTRLNAAQQSLGGAQDRLASVVARVPKSTDEAQKAVSDLIAWVAGLLCSFKLTTWVHSELNKLKDSATANVKELVRMLALSRPCSEGPASHSPPTCSRSSTP